MGRRAREISETGLYHIVFRGINKQHIFEESVDYNKMKSILKEIKEEMKFEIYVYCFMTNNVRPLLSITTHYYYDNAGRNVCVEAPIDEYRTAKTLYGYDPNGNVVSTKVLTNLENGEETYRNIYNTYDNMNRPSSVNTGVAYIRYYYDNMGNLTKTSEYTEIYADEDDGIDTTYTYDDLGRMISTTTPDGLTEAADYDYLGRVKTSTDKAGRITSLSYDSFNNLLSKSIGEESVSYTYNLLGLPTSMTDSTGTTTYAYNPFGELTTETKGDIIKSYTYDDLSRRTAFNVADGEENVLNQTYSYDVMGRLVDTSSGEDTVSYTYDANSNLLTKAHNGNVYHTAQYNKANMPVVTQLYNEGVLADTTHYTYNLDGNLAMTIGSKVSSLYYYDNANRLVHESSWGDGIDYSDDYDYDFRGNRTKRVHKDKLTDATETTDYTYNIINQLTNQTNGTDTVNYNYDTVGNMTSVTKNGTTEKTYTYDAFNRLATANVNGTTSSYTYNGNNLRQTKTVNGVTTSHIYDGANIVADQSTDTTVFIRGIGLALLKNGTITQVYGITPRGDVAKLMTPNGTTTDYTYTAYGEPTSANNSIHNPFGYTGEYTDAETGLVYLRNRYYDPETGIFITIDPAKDGFNWYIYCDNDPINYVDSDGLKKKSSDVTYGTPYYNGDADCINGQSVNTAVKDLTYGKDTISNNGCELIAVYNAMTLVDNAQEFSDIIEKAENTKGVMWLEGYFGSYPKQLGKLFDKYDQEYTKITKETEFNDYLEDGGVYIVSVWNSSTPLG